MIEVISGAVDGVSNVEVSMEQIAPVVTFESILDVYCGMSRFVISSVVDSILETYGGVAIINTGTDVEGVSTFVIFVFILDVFTLISRLCISTA